MNRASSESSADVKKRVINARKIQQDRFKKDSISSNNEMTNKQIEKYCNLNESGRSLMEQAINNLKLSARAYMRVLKLSRTIADLDGSKSIETKHITEALQYRA